MTYPNFVEKRAMVQIVFDADSSSLEREARMTYINDHVMVVLLIFLIFILLLTICAFCRLTWKSCKEEECVFSSNATLPENGDNECLPRANLYQSTANTYCTKNTKITARKDSEV